MDIQRYSIKLDMKSVGAVDTGIRLKQGDSGMILDFYIYSGGTIWNSSEDTPAVVIYKPDGNVVYDYAYISGNAYSYTIKGEELTAAGTAKADVKFTLENGRESTRTFTFYIEPDTLSEGAHESKSYISPVEKAVADITQTYIPEIEAIEQLAKDWAVGPSGTEEAGTDTNNAKYWAEVAQQAGASGSGANEIDYDSSTNTLTISRDGVELDNTTIEIENTPVVTSWSATPSDENVPSEKLVKDSFGGIPTESKTASIDGTDLSLVTTGEKYAWNNKANQTYVDGMVGTSSQFDASATYTKGDYFIHDNTLYYVKVATISGATPPNSTYYDVVSMSALNDSLNDYSEDNLTLTAKAGCGVTPKIIKKGNIVTLEVREFYPLLAWSTGSDILATFPSKYIPKSDIIDIGSFCLNGSARLFVQGSNLCGYRADGKTGTGYKMFGSATWFV